MENQDIASRLILELLSSGAPEFGARLKQRLNVLLVSKGLGTFNERSYGHKRFSDFLQAVLGDQISIERPKAAGDIQVSLRHPQEILTTASISSLGHPPMRRGISPVIRSDVWQAFTNPDSKRKRFFHKNTSAIRHFLLGESSPFREEVERAPSLFVEIEQISALTQLGWMRDFLDSVKLPLSQRAPLAALIVEPYSSGVNATFTRALGEHGDAWRHCRTKHVTDVIRAWAEKHDVLFEALCVQKDSKIPTLTQSQSAQAKLTPHQQASKLLDLLTDDDIARLVIPTLLSTILVKSRL